MRISDWSSDVCSSDLGELLGIVERVHDGDAVEPVAVCQHRNHVDTATPTEEVVGGGEPEAVALHDLGIVNGDGQLALRVRDGARAVLAAEAALTGTHLGFRRRSRALVAHREIGRAHVCTPVTNAQIVCRLLLEKKKIHYNTQTHQSS